MSARDAAEKLPFQRPRERPATGIRDPPLAASNHPLGKQNTCLLGLLAPGAAYPDGYGFTWFCDRFAVLRQRASPTFRNRHAAGAVMQTDYAGQTVPVTPIHTTSGSTSHAARRSETSGAANSCMRAFGQTRRAISQRCW
ncbi:MAG: hypothetical protein EOR51_11085 [Mesorhizobium sp.]|nr:MAG: hypothetical protein EOQ88_33400 [Mesorhizobium sp.]RWK51608.1 MAG: hypothetical protein EOR48_25205 [Mesorhizobium sp.]RWK82679.1 MAG: hypothetical protein EOR51_11085 [Mesorhizobium sp.]RWK98868.1 MAG: hypothetical protein EOR55_34220 [Mesorhizobium sp.]